MAFSKTERRNKIKRRVRGVVSGTSSRPRLTVFRSNKEIYAQMVDDVNGRTLVSASSRDKDVAVDGMNKSQAAHEVGKKLAERAVAAGIETCAFDRNGYLYHGRVKQLADGAREGGLKF
jgi:large subunit ribosomal protein L18